MDSETASIRSVSSLSRLEKLPPHVLSSICIDLACHEFSRRSLFAFSLTSRVCCSATERERFRRLRLTMETPEKMLLDVQRWREILAIGNRMKYVRLLKASGGMLKEGEEHEGMENLYKGGYSYAFPETLPGEQEQKLKEWDDACVMIWRGTNSSYHPPDLPLSKEALEASEAAWKPLAELCRALPRLQDIIYAGLNQIPICLLSAIHEAHPESNLHITHFHLRTLYLPAPSPSPVQVKWERDIVTSPCLRSITMANINRRPGHWEGESILHVVRETAPKLRHVHNWKVSILPHYGDFPFSLYKIKEGNKQPGLAQLETLHINGDRNQGDTYVYADMMRAWTDRTDFRVLRSLRLEEPICEAALEYLTAIAQEGHCAALRSLYLKPEEPSDRPESKNLDAIVSRLLLALNPLEELHLRGFVGEAALETTIARHLSTLLKFTFAPGRRDGFGLFSMSLQDIANIAEKALHLKELEIIVPRLNGSEEEVAMYRHIGSLPLLQNLKLLLDCTISELLVREREGVNLEELIGSEPFLPRECSPIVFEDGTELSDESTDELLWAEEYHLAVVNQPRNALMNAAMDSDLALDIFRVLTSHSRSIQRVEIEPCGWNSGFSYPLTSFNETFSAAMRWVGRQWILEKTVWDTEVRVVEGKAEAREEAKEDTKLDPQAWALIEAAWDELWPGPRSDTWLDDWSSFPLHRSGEQTVSHHSS